MSAAWGGRLTCISGNSIFVSNKGIAPLETPATKVGALRQGTPDVSEVSRKRRRRDIFVAHVTPPSKAPSGATSLEYVDPDGACGIGLAGALKCRAYGARASFRPPRLAGRRRRPQPGSKADL